MRLRRVGKDRLAITGIPPFFAEILNELPALAGDLTPEAENRFYPSPSRDDKELASDWKAHVEPELQRLFAEARDVAAADLRRMTSSGGQHRLEIPLHHAEAWLSALNQARFALAEKHGFTEAEMARGLDGPFVEPRDQARLKVDFFAAMQEWIISQTDP